MIARLSLKDQQLTFEWTSEAAGEKSAEYLRNCQLSLSAESANHVLGLRKPMELAPLAIDLNKPATKEEWRIDAAPDPESIEVQITSVGGPFPGAATFDPPQPLPAARGSQRVLFGEKPEENGVYLVVQTSMRRSLEITVTPMFKIGEFPAENFSKANVEKYSKMALAAVANSKLKAQQLTALKNSKLNPQQLKKLGIDDPKQIDGQINLANQDFDKFSGLVGRFETLKTLVDALNGAATIEFRAYMRAGASQVDLVRTAGAAQGPAPEAEAKPESGAMADAK